jgi:ribokinase
MDLKRIVVIGSCNTDMVISAERLPKPGETVLGGNFKMFSGGKGANQAVAAARLGGNVTFITKTGNDLFGKQNIKQYETDCIDIRYISSDLNLPTGVALITVDRKGENCIVVASGANAALSPEDINRAREVIEKSDILLLQLEIPMETVEYAAALAHKKGVKVILNPAPAASLSDKLLKYLYAIIPNKNEAEKISGIPISDTSSAKRSADVIAGKGVDKVIITLGEKGAFIRDGPDYYEIPAEKVKAVDTTAAGDAFCGALCVGLSEGLTIEKAAKIANKASAITVSRAGAQNSLPYKNEIFDESI